MSLGVVNHDSSTDVARMMPTMFRVHDHDVL